MFQRKLSILVLLSLVITGGVMAQQVKLVTGTVYDQESGTPVAGVTVTNQENKTYVITSVTGAYSIGAVAGESLIFSYVGFAQTKIPINVNTNKVDVSLSNNFTQLSDVVVTGALGIKRAARELGASAQIVDSKTLNQGKTVNPLFGLTGKVAGLRINMYDSKVDPAAQITLRGTRSLQRTSGIDGRNPNAPLYVVDGMPIPDIGRLNPNDIANITVLKGANAAALYGSEGVNGALMITTKTGQRGRSTVAFSNTTTFSNAFLLPGAQKIYGQGNNGTYNPETYESWGPRFDGSMRPFGPPLPDGTQPQLLYEAPAKDNRQDLFQTGINVQNDISFSGGDQNSTYFMSLQHVDQSGIIPKDENTRIGLRFNGTRKFGKLATAYNLNYINNKKEITPDGPWVGAYRMPANFDYDFIKDWESATSPGNPNNYFVGDGSWVRNPYFLIDNIRDASNQQIINGKIDFNYEFSEWFSALYRVGLYSLNDAIRNSTRKFQTLRANNTNGSINDASNNYQRFNSDLILSFNKDFGDLSTRLLLGQNLRTDYKKTHNIKAGNLLYPDVFNPESRAGELEGGVEINEQRSAAVYGEFTAGFKNYLFITLTGRNDWVSTLSPENNSYFYPGVSASFIATDAITELKESEKLSFLKLYTSWNKTGNVTLTPYQLNNAYSTGSGFPYGGTVGFLPSLTYPNPDIRPEFVTSFEAGIQLGLFNNRLNMDAAYVYSDADGQISNASISRATGYNATIVNSGRLVNSIAELSVNGDVIRNENIIWNIGINYTYTKNVLKELYEGALYRQNFRQSYGIVGLQYPSLWVSDYQRDTQGKLVPGTEGNPIYENPKKGNVVVDENGDPILATDNVVLGTLIPPHLFGFSTQFSFKGFSLGAQLDARWGGWMYSEVVPAMYQYGTHLITTTNDRQPFVWPGSVVETSTGIYQPNTQPTSGAGKEFWTEQGSIQSNTAVKSDFIKLREVNISYVLPSKLLANQRVLKEIGIGLVANNLFIIRHKDNDIGDPEYLYNNTDGYSSFRQIPPVRTFGFTVNVKF